MARAASQGQYLETDNNAEFVHNVAANLPLRVATLLTQSEVRHIKKCQTQIVLISLLWFDTLRLPCEMQASLLCCVAFLF